VGQFLNDLFSSPLTRRALSLRCLLLGTFISVKNIVDVGSGAFRVPAEDGETEDGAFGLAVYYSSCVLGLGLAGGLLTRVGWWNSLCIGPLLNDISSSYRITDQTTDPSSCLLDETTP
jgi:hypothetical protein